MIKITEIKLDYDGKRLPIRRINYVYKILRMNLKDVKVYKTIRKWKPLKRKPDYGWHVKLKVMENIPIYHLVSIQTLMGSCYKRECYNFIRVVNLLTRKITGPITQNWNVLYSKKKIGGKVASVEKFDKQMTEKLRERLKWKQ